MKTQIKKTYVCRKISDYSLLVAIPRAYTAEAGDVGVFEVMHIGKHSYVQSDTKRNVKIMEGDRIMAAFGTRYATAQIEGYLPLHLEQDLHILGAGGTIGVVKSMHSRFEEVGPTIIRLVGLATHPDGRVMNTKKMEQARLAIFNASAISTARIILSLGSSMDSGKTTSAAYLVHGLRAAGHKVAFIKLTGTVYTKDCDLATDLGADISVDFGEFGYPSTYMCNEEELLDLYASLVEFVMREKPDDIIMEIADGLFERETKMLLTNEAFISTIHGVVFSAGDSLAAVNGEQLLNKWGIKPNFLCGLFTTSPLLIQEVRENSDTPVYSIHELASGKLASILFPNGKHTLPKGKHQRLELNGALSYR